ncbi:MAG: DUF1801 domain-containing protein [Planctomycetes bacterium]|nr:DUF1801 domain-containing protein [Planctomycetota bacterium]
MDSRLDQLFNNAARWKAEAGKLREILDDCGLSEEFKWGKACYSFDGKNIAILQRMKDHVALMFFKGVLLEDPMGVLEKPGENSRSGRRLCFTSVRDIVKFKPLLRAFVHEAIEIEKAGLKVSKSTELDLVEELEQRLKSDPALKAAFIGLTLGRQRGYNLYFSAPVKSSTRERRIEKYAPKILSGRGMRD